MTAPQAQSLSLMLRRSAARHGEKAALIFGDERWSYSIFDEIVDELAAGLDELGVEKGDRIAILARNSAAFLAIRFAVARIGAVLVPVNVMLGAADIAYILDHSGARFLFADTSLLEIGRQAAAAAGGRVEGVFLVEGEGTGATGAIAYWSSLRIAGATIEDRADADDLLQIIYTSGTESRPKGAMLSHAAVLWQYQSCLFDCDWTADTVILHALPLFHCAALDAMAGPALQAGATSVISASAAPDQVLSLDHKSRRQLCSV